MPPPGASRPARRVMLVTCDDRNVCTQEAAASPRMSLRIVLADDHPIVANGARQLLEQDPTLQVVSVVASPDELLQTLERTACDLVVTDFSMPGGNAPDG